MPLGSAEALALAGRTGSGRSTLAAEASRLLGRRAAPTDVEMVRRAGKPIAAVFAEGGEAAFRALLHRRTHHPVAVGARSPPAVARRIVELAARPAPERLLGAG
jgi:shikimate kinase